MTFTLMFKSFIVISLAAVGSSLKLHQLGDSDYDEESMTKLFEFLKDLEIELTRMNEERIATFSQGFQQAQLEDNGDFSFPPDCSPTTQILSYSYCFHGNLVNDSKTTIDAKVDLFDIDDPRDNTVVGLTAVYDGGTQSELKVHAGGDAHIVSFGNRKKAAATVFLKAYDEELTQSLGLGDISKENFIAIPHFKIYGLNRLLLDIDVQPGDTSTSYVFAGEPYNLGFNVSVYVEQTIKLGIKVGGAIDLSLTTVKNNANTWLLQGTARVVVKPPIGPNFNFPYDYITATYIYI